MAFLFKRNPKTPAELVRAMNDQVTKLDTANDKRKVQDEITRYLIGIKSILNGGPDDSLSGEPQPDQLAQLAHEVYASDSLHLLIQNLINIEFDSRKVVVLLFASLLRRKIANRSPTVDYLLQRTNILILLMKGTENPEISIHTTNMLKDAIKYEQVTQFLLFDTSFWNYFDYCQSESFEISTDAFSILIDLLTLHKKATSEFFNAHKARFIDNINSLITSSNYVTKREAIRLLSQLILSKTNYSLMTAYVSSPHNLKIIMILLGDKSKNIQIESFNVFKVFVANPRKTKPITDILIKNRDKLLKFLDDFNADRRQNDDLFTVEKNFVIEQIHELPKIVASTSPLEQSSFPS